METIFKPEHLSGRQLLLWPSSVALQKTLGGFVAFRGEGSYIAEEE